MGFGPSRGLLVANCQLGAEICYNHLIQLFEKAGLRLTWREGGLALCRPLCQSLDGYWVKPSGAYKEERCLSRATMHLRVVCGHK